MTETSIVCNNMQAYKLYYYAFIKRIHLPFFLVIRVFLHIYLTPQQSKSNII